MCDYSLMGVANRLATEGEDLVVHRFSTGTVGLTCPRSTNPAVGSGFWTAIRQILVDPAPHQNVAVCIPPGACLLVRDMPEEVRQAFNSEPTELVTFTQVSARENTHRDAIRLNNGAEILLQKLREGQRVRVLQISVPEAEVTPVPNAKHEAKTMTD